MHDPTKFIHIRGAREHNLKNINLDIPKGKLVVITGVSGSGKSSLAFDTIYAEGQRRYVESLSAYARQFLQLMEKPDVDLIEGLSPAISIEQKTTSKNPRSTVATVTEIYDYLRLLYARVGIPYSPTTGKPIESQTVSQMVDRIMTHDEGWKFYILAPIARGKKGEYKKELTDLQKKGFLRVIVDGTLMNLDEVPALEKNIRHDIEVVVDRLVMKPGIETRLADTLETALDMGQGLIYVQDATTNDRQMFSANFACPVSGFTIPEIEPRLFSFNSPHGACEACDGLGEKVVFDADLLIPDHALPFIDAVAPWNTDKAGYYQGVLTSIAKHFDVDPSLPYKDVPKKLKDVLLNGTRERIMFIFDSTSYGHYKKSKPYEGLLAFFDRRFRETSSDMIQEELSKYQKALPCETCHGWRLSERARAVKIDGKHIGEITLLSIEDAHTWANTLESHLTQKQTEIAHRILKEVRERLSFLVNVGLNYLTLSRKAGTLSGGESQRIRLASQIGSGLTGVLYVLDEPSIGLHQRDNDQLIATLKHLRNLDNTVIVVEHDEDTMKACDYLIDMGPFAGVHGGTIVSEGIPSYVMADPASLTGAYLSGRQAIELPTERRKGSGNTLRIEGATHNNLKNVTVDIPLGTLTCVTGVSGGGKSSLVIATLYKALAKHFYRASDTPGHYKAIKGLEHIDKVIDIDQSPIGRTPRSNPATYTGCFNYIRDWFAALPEAKARGYAAGRFSFNVKGGRCESCQGDGVIKIEMHFLPDVYVECDQCKGRRYNRETLDVKYKDKSIADVLTMTVEDGVIFFENVPTIRRKLETLQRVGLGYIQIGQRATTLSGGEAQRIKLSKELSKRATGQTLYILDEPTTGLHYHDIEQLLSVLQELVGQGNTVLVIEHNLEVIKTADHIIDIGPEGGERGGTIVAKGTPEEICKVKASYTGKYLKPYLKAKQ
ncbi:excinuclease ABC subunit UvrA [Candidatus Bodocaedibacter vickermanii]|uniref:UvrABC system protein A n=1 Tax=Candidatus Bodocaedibacter vickermanii TaxID=2741701 RepID=A0A7L9RRX0_9PROT|nr:UvrABC system protein A [Candidatus Paracaedibacteraceae bacterium 'Lake Konstanz']